MDGDDDHVRLRVDVSPKVAISKLVTGLNCVSSRSLAIFALVQRKPPGTACWCSPSYLAAALCGGSLAIIRQYLEQQRSPD
jgi:putative transposase